jgi:hypothetical protein
MSADAGALMAGGLIGAIIGIGIGALIGALFIMLGSKIVMGSTATFGSAFVAALVSAVVGFCLAFAAGLVLGAVAPAQAGMAQWLGMGINLLVTPAIYSAMVKTSAGAKPTYIQGLLIYLVQIVILAVLAGIAVYALNIQIPGMPAF